MASEVKANAIYTDELFVNGSPVEGITGATGPTGPTGADGSSALPTGSITMFAGVSAPTGWLVLDGSAVSRTTYSALYALLGTTYGIGDGSTTFNLPDTRGVFIRGAGTSSIDGITYTGTRGTSNVDQFQGHWHNVYSPTGAGSTFVWGMQAWTNNRSPTLSLTPDQGVREPVNGGYGTPRYGSETQPANITLTYIIKY